MKLPINRAKGKDSLEAPPYGYYYGRCVLCKNKRLEGAMRYIITYHEQNLHAKTIQFNKIRGLRSIVTVF